MTHGYKADDGADEDEDEDNSDDDVFDYDI